MMVELDGRCMTNRSAAHEYLSSTLSLPAHYGRNLDALYDLLTEMSGSLTILHPEALAENLGPYGTALLKTFREAAENNPRLSLHI